VKSKTKALTVRALRTTQATGVETYAFFIRGSDIMRIADISRVSREENDGLKGFQRKEIQQHVKGIVEYLDRGHVLFPNAIILAFGSEVRFKQSRGPAPTGALDLSDAGTLTIPMREESRRVAWIVDGQQRSLALSRTNNVNLPVPVIGFISPDVSTQREQFVLVNKAKPLPNRLINELLPEIGAQLPRDLAQRRIPSELCSLLDRDTNSPFFKMIKRVSKADGADAGIIVDTALITVIKQSINSPLGALALFKNSDGESDLDGMYRTLCVYWSGVQAEFGNAWGKPPQQSRLMHSAGIQAMGFLMDRIMPRFAGNPDIQSEVRKALRRIAPHCAWTDGKWEALGLAWNQVQNVNRHVRQLADYLVQLDYRLSSKAA
jgi:DGQHR domain-containing protein